MSNIYIQEPSTLGKVLLKTTVGDIDVELWSRECPKACRNFIQLCMEGYYNGTIFHRVVKDFIVQGGDPCGDGSGGESIYGAPFNDEFHSRLRFTRRGLVAMATTDKNDNGSQFFFTMDATPELQNKNTLFGKVTGNTLFNMLKLQEGLVDHNERPMYPEKILTAVILNNPFTDIVPRKTQTKKKVTKKQSVKKKGVKNFGLLSFGEEAEEDEVETSEFVQKNAGKAKSLHDVSDDPKLSKQSLQITSNNNDDDHDDSDDDNEVNTTTKDESIKTDIQIKQIKDKLRSKSEKSEKSEKTEKSEKSNENKRQKLERNCDNKEHSDESDEDYLKFHDEERKMQIISKKEEIRKEIATIKKQYQIEKRNKEKLLEKDTFVASTSKPIEKDTENEIVMQFVEEREKYKNLQTQIPLKGSNRENFTLNLLSNFRNKLKSLKQNSSKQQEENDDSIEDDIHTDKWLCHTLEFQDANPVLAKDASTKSDDWYDAYDPRNPLNKRKRNEGNQKQQKHQNHKV